MIEGSLEFKMQQELHQIKKGNCRTSSLAIPLRGAGFTVEMVPIFRRYHSGMKRTLVPFAPAWAVHLAKRLRQIKADAKAKRNALIEARELGKAGPQAEAILVAAKMMEK